MRSSASSTTLLTLVISILSSDSEGAAPINGSTRKSPPVVVIIHERQQFELNCNGSTDSGPTATWKKDGVKINVSRPEMAHYKLQHNELLIEKVNSTAVGDYECHSGNHIGRFMVRGKPRVQFNMSHLERSQTVVVSEGWTVSCMFVDKYYSVGARIDLLRCKQDEVKFWPWCGRQNRSQLIEDTTQWIQKNKGRVSIRNLTSENGTSILLSIARVHYQDIAVFMCSGLNWATPYERLNVSMILRVRDRLDFVWPMVLLSGLALYLIGLVTVFETRRIRATSFLKFEKLDKI